MSLQAKDLDLQRIIREICELFRRYGAAVISTELKISPQLGQYLLVYVDAPASTAMKAWLELVSHAKKLLGITVPIFVKWNGDCDLKPEELGAMLGRILADMDVHPATMETFDIVELLKEEYEKEL